jgi:hypothetical protein
MTLFYDAGWSRQSVHRSTRDTILRECSTEQDLAKRRDEKSLRGLTPALPFHNCVLSKHETETARAELTYTAGISKRLDQVVKVALVRVCSICIFKSHQRGLGLTDPCLDIECGYFRISDKFKLQILWPC